MTIRAQLKPRLFPSLGIVALLLFQALEVAIAATAKVPAINGPYVRVYAPGEDVFPGPDSPNFKTGQSYKEWVPNDHAIIKDRDQCWHAIGITHPKPPDFDPPRNGPAVHEAEWLFFHALSPGGRLKENLKDGSWRDAKKILTPRERPGENKLCYAPAIVAKDHLFHMIYGPNPMRLATSADLFNWKPCGPLFSDDGSARDPSILFHDGRYILCYVAGNKVLARTATDLRQWSANAVEVFRMRRGGVPESPVVVKHDGQFYLFYCIYDAHDEVNGAYDNRTFVFRSANPMDFNSAPCVAELKAHAPEIFQDEDGDWFMSSVEWPHRGVSIAPLVWKQQPVPSEERERLRR
jgi:beta-fructofuranosidase